MTRRVRVDAAVERLLRRAESDELPSYSLGFKILRFWCLVSGLTFGV